MGLNDSTILNKIFRYLPPNIFWAGIISIISGFIMWLFNFADFYIGFVITLTAFYLVASLYLLGRQIYWFIAKKGDYRTK